MRLAHITDLHLERTPQLSDLANKRLLGAVNLYLMGRSKHFSAASQRGVVEALLRLAPDRVVCTGDLTATATDAEFDAFIEFIKPVVDRMPFDCIPGNHDVYTAESAGRYRERFDPAFSPLRTVDIGPLTLCLVDVCFPDWLSRGRAEPSTLGLLDEALGAADKSVILCLHYPLRDRRGEVYGPPKRALMNASEIEALIDKHPCVKAVLHGHEHHGFSTTVGVRSVPIFNPGAAGYAFLPKKGRTAHFNVYEVDDTGIVGVERYAWNGTTFEPEKGGSYATGG